MESRSAAQHVHTNILIESAPPTARFPNVLMWRSTPIPFSRKVLHPQKKSNQVIVEPHAIQIGNCTHVYQFSTFAARCLPTPYAQ